MFKKISITEIDNIEIKNFDLTKHCFYCGCYDDKVNANGTSYCPNPKCNGTGAIWFNETLNSFEECIDGYMIDEDEKNIKADEYIIKNDMKFVFIDKNKIRKICNDNKENNKYNIVNIKEINQE